METDSEQSERTPINELIDEDVWGFGGNISDELELDFLIYLNDFEESSTKKQSVNETPIKEKVQKNKDQTLENEWIIPKNQLKIKREVPQSHNLELIILK